MNEESHSCQCLEENDPVTLTMRKKTNPGKTKSENRISLTCSDRHKCVCQEKEVK